MKKYIQVFLTIVTVVIYNANNISFSEQITERTTSGFYDDDDYYDDNDTFKNSEFLLKETDTLREVSNKNGNNAEIFNNNRLLQKSNALTSKEIDNIEYNILPLEKLNKIVNTINDKITEINEYIQEAFQGKKNSDISSLYYLSNCKDILVKHFNALNELLNNCEIENPKILITNYIDLCSFIMNIIKQLNTDFNSINKLAKVKYNKKTLSELLIDFNECIDNNILPELKNVLPKEEKLTDQDIRIQKIVKNLNNLQNEIEKDKSHIYNSIGLVFNQSNANILKKHLEKQYDKLNYISKYLKKLTKKHVNDNKQNEIQALLENYKLCLENINNIFTDNYKLIIDNISKIEENCMKNNSVWSNSWLNTFNKHIMDKYNNEVINTNNVY